MGLESLPLPLVLQHLVKNQKVPMTCEELSINNLHKLVLFYLAHTFNARLLLSSPNTTDLIKGWYLES